MRGLKNNNFVGNDGIPSEVYMFASEQLLTLMTIFLSLCVLTDKLPRTLIHHNNNNFIETMLQDIIGK